MTDASKGLIATLSAAAAGVIVGAAALTYHQKKQENEKRERKLEKLRERSARYNEKKLLDNFINEQQNRNQQRRKVDLYFDHNDEMVEKEEDFSDPENMPSKEDRDAKDAENLKKKLRAVELNNYQTKITINVGSEEYDKGKEKITNDIFRGKNKLQNTELFIENLQKTKAKKQSDQTPVRDSEEEVEKRPESDKKKVEVPKSTEQVIMDLNPEKLEKKDHIFMDFFSMYGANFVQ